MERVVILGAGESGTGSAVLAKQKGCQVLYPIMGQSGIGTGRYLTVRVFYGRRESILKVKFCRLAR